MKHCSNNSTIWRVQKYVDTFVIEYTRVIQTEDIMNFTNQIVGRNYITHNVYSRHRRSN